LASALKRARTFAMDPRSAPWYYLHVEAYQKGVVVQQGPIPFDELHVMYKDGKVERDTFVWSECHEADDFFQIESVPELVAALEVPLEGDAAKAEDLTTSVTQSLPENPPKDETRPPESAADTEANTTKKETEPVERASAPEQTTTLPIAPAPSPAPSSMRTPGRSGSGALEAIMRRVGGSNAKRVASPRLASRGRFTTSRRGDDDDDASDDASSSDDDETDDVEAEVMLGRKKWFPDVENALNVEYAALKRALHKDYVAHVRKLEASLESIEARIRDARERRAAVRRETARERREHERLARSANDVARELERLRRREEELGERERAARDREDEIASATAELASRAEDLARRERVLERRERAVQNETEALDARGRELDAQFDACEATMAKCKAERDEHANAMREVSEVERRLEEDARRIAAQGEALARRGEEDRRRVKEREAAIERREAAIAEKAEEAEAVLAMEREAVRLAIGDRFEEMERSRREVMAAAARKAEDPAWDAAPPPPPRISHPSTAAARHSSPSSFRTPRRPPPPPPPPPQHSQHSQHSQHQHQPHPHPRDDDVGVVGGEASVLTGAGARWAAGVPSPAAAAAVRKGAVLVPVYRGGMPGAGGVRICDVAVASTTTLGGLRSALAAHLGLSTRDGLAIRRRGTAVPPTQDHLPASTYFGSYDDAVVLD